MPIGDRFMQPLLHFTCLALQVICAAVYFVFAVVFVHTKCTQSFVVHLPRFYFKDQLMWPASSRSAYACVCLAVLVCVTLAAAGAQHPPAAAAAAVPDAMAI